jgi:hypothetical protein
MLAIPNRMWERGNSSFLRFVGNQERISLLYKMAALLVNVANSTSCDYRLDD